MTTNGVNILSTHPIYNHCIDIAYKGKGFMLNTKSSILYSKEFSEKAGSRFKRVDNKNLIKLITEAVDKGI